MDFERSQVDQSTINIDSQDFDKHGFYEQSRACFYFDKPN